MQQLICTPKKRRFSAEFEAKVLAYTNAKRIAFDLTWIKKNDQFVAEFKSMLTNGKKHTNITITENEFGNLKKSIINFVKAFE